MDIVEIAGYAATVIAIASAITALTPTPKDDKLIGQLYKIIEYCALAVGKAKDKAGESK